MSRTHRSTISYIDRSRDYYAAQGYSQPYKWAANTDAPFTPLPRPLNECRVGVVTTTKRHADDPLQPFAAASSPQPTEMATDHLHWHQEATHTNDVGSFLPLDHLQTLVDEGRIGSVSPRYYSVSTIYSQRRTITWAEQVREWAVEDGVDAMLLVPL